MLDVAQQRVDELERRWSRFIADSEISRLNAATGRPLAVSDDTRLLVERAVEAWRLTGGGFDPTVLRAVEAAGYTESFELLGDRLPVSVGLPAPVGRVGCTDIEIVGDTVRLPDGIGFDPGGIGKGLAADLVVEELLEAGADGVCVNLGGDLRVAGESPVGAWTVAIEHAAGRTGPGSPRLGLRSGAMATSTTLRRRWTVEGGEERHHLIDPSTGEPSTTDITQATVIADEAWVAEVMAKAVLLRGVERAFDVITPDLDAIVVDEHGHITAHRRRRRSTSAARSCALVHPSKARPSRTRRRQVVERARVVPEAMAGAGDRPLPREQRPRVGRRLWLTSLRCRRPSSSSTTATPRGGSTPTSCDRRGRASGVGDASASSRSPPSTSATGAARSGLSSPMRTRPGWSRPSGPPSTPIGSSTTRSRRPRGSSPTTRTATPEWSTAPASSSTDPASTAGPALRAPPSPPSTPASRRSTGSRRCAGKLPIRVEWSAREDGGEVATVRAWSRDDWGPEGETMAWCCTEGDRAYVGDRPVVESLAEELTAIVGAEVYVELRRRVTARRPDAR